MNVLDMHFNFKILKTLIVVTRFLFSDLANTTTKVSNYTYSHYAYTHYSMSKIFIFRVEKSYAALKCKYNGIILQ